MSVAIFNKDGRGSDCFFCDSSFVFVDMAGINFLNSKGKAMMIDDPSNRPSDFCYCTFCSTFVLIS